MRSSDVGFKGEMRGVYAAAAEGKCVNSQSMKDTHAALKR